MFGAGMQSNAVQGAVTVLPAAVGGCFWCVSQRREERARWLENCVIMSTNTAKLTAHAQGALDGLL